MSLLVLKSGLLDSVQDLGRHGLAHLGIHAAGVADPVALRVANALVGNVPETAGIEMHFPAPQLRFEQAVVFALGGADFGARLDGRDVPVGSPVRAGAGSELVFRRYNRGMRVYLCVQGGFALEPWLGSCSTDLLAGVGGWQGRALLAGDKLPFRQNMLEPQSGSQFFLWRANTSGLYPREAVYRFLPGPEHHLLDPLSCQVLENAEWCMGRRSNRMACAVDGPPLLLREKYELVSSAVQPGTVQLLPGGAILILLADSQTTGGYPRVAQVAEADLPGLAQQRPGAVFRLRKAEREEVLESGREHRRALRRLEWGALFKTSDFASASP
ncbi:MAG: biotin-dependent carboxyltransferase family protein [Saprospiraceae bacterium]